MTSLPDKAEVLRRFDDVDRRLTAAAAFSRLLAVLDEDEEAQRLAEEARAALAELKEERRALKVFVGRGPGRQVRQAEIACTGLVGRLAARDRDLSTAALRQYLRQTPHRNLHELGSLLDFYVQLEHEPRWSSDRVDKVDLLLTELSQRLGDSNGEPGGGRLGQILAASDATPRAPITELERRTFERHLMTIGSEVEAASSLGELIDSGTLQRYRSLKHRLGHLLLHPDLLTAVIRTNQLLQRKIRRLNSRTMTGIFSVYQGIFERGLKGGIDPGLRQEIDQLHLDFDRFERRVKRDDVRLTELESFWSNLRDFSARLDRAAAAQAAAEPAAASSPTAAPTPADDPLAESSANWLEEEVLALLDLLRENDRKGWPAEYVSFPPGEGFQLDPREIMAFRRLADQEAVDGALEVFLLKAAALRRSIKRSARKLAEAPDAEVSRELPVFATARKAVQAAESFLARYAQAVEQAILDGDASEAQQLQILRMRLIRESAGIWLQVHQPS